MKFMLLMKGDEQAEAGVLPDESIIAAMHKYNEDLVKSGALLSAEGLHPTSRGARIRLAGRKRTTTDGPFAEAKEVVAGYWIFQTKTKLEALDWAKRCPGAAGQLELRQLYEMEDFPVDPAEQTDGWRSKEEEMRKEMDKPTTLAPVPGTKRFIAMLKSNSFSESGVLPDEQMLSAMGKLMEDMANAGVAIGGEGLKPTRDGFQIKCDKVIDGPFAEAKELVAGFCMLRCKSLAEAIEWSWRWLDVHCGGNFAKDGEIQIREVFELSDLPSSPAVEREKKLREQMAQR
jgi:hypothetical protein